MQRVPLIIIGNICADFFLPPHDAPSPGSLVFLDEAPELSIGGNCANTAITVARLGVETAVAGVLGDNEIGELLRRTLTENGVDVRHLERVPGEKAPLTLVRNTAGGERSFAHHRGSNAAWRLPTACLERPCEIFHFAAPELLEGFWPEGCLDAARTLRGQGVRVALDVAVQSGEGGRPHEFIEQLVPLLEHTDMVFPNDDESRLITGRDAIDERLDWFHEHGVDTVLIKRGPKGCVVSTGKRRVDVPTERVTSVDTCGAGDNFAGAFLAGILRGLGPETSARFGCRMGTLCVQKRGAVAASEDVDTIRQLRAAFEI